MARGPEVLEVRTPMNSFFGFPSSSSRESSEGSEPQRGFGGRCIDSDTSLACHAPPIFCSGGGGGNIERANCSDEH
jgi:hypothetical protein